jgi:nicotinamidase-related amidase
MKRTLKTANKSPRIKREKAGLVVVDIQDRLLPQIFEKERLIKNTLLLLKGAAILRVPVLVTEQYRKGLGLTAPEIGGAIANFAPMEKATFSACGAEGFEPALKEKGITDVILCGMESHICVLQTCLDLLDHGFRVFIAADAVSSRTLENWHLGLERMRDADAVIASTEMLLFEILERAGTDEFRQVLQLVK